MHSQTMMKYPINKTTITAIIYLAFFPIFVWVIYRYFHHAGWDWVHYFRPAALELLSGRSPYVPGFYNPPWVLLVYLPLVSLSIELGSAILFVINLYAYIYAAHKLGLRPIKITLFLAVIFPFLNAFNGNIDGLVTLGFILPPQIGLFFVLSKPQIGLPISLFWFIEAWRNGGVVIALRRFFPVTTAFLFSFILFGFWPLAFSSGDLLGASWNMSIWPFGIPIGIVLLGLSIILSRKEFSISAGPFLSPYLAYTAWAFVWLGILPFIPSIRDTWHALTGLKRRPKYSSLRNNRNIFN